MGVEHRSIDGLPPIAVAVCVRKCLCGDDGNASLAAEQSDVRQRRLLSDAGSLNENGNHKRARNERTSDRLGNR